MQDDRDNLSGIQVNDDASLTDIQLGELKRVLLGKRNDLAARIEALNQQITAKNDCSVADAAEAASIQEDRIRAAGIAANDRQTIAEIDVALGRLAKGQYGISEVTGEPIAYERLLLIPWARTGADE